MKVCTHYIGAQTSILYRLNRKKRTNFLQLCIGSWIKLDMTIIFRTFYYLLVIDEIGWSDEWMQKRISCQLNWRAFPFTTWILVNVSDEILRLVYNKEKGRKISILPVIACVRQSWVGALETSTLLSFRLDNIEDILLWSPIFRIHDHRMWHPATLLGGL